MNRKEFMAQLGRLLYDIPRQEREEALNYYNGYFDDAGEENESSIIQELGSPGKVAAMIKEDLTENRKEYGEYSEQGYGDERFDDRNMPERVETIRSEEKKEEQNAGPKQGADNSGTSGEQSYRQGQSGSYDGPYSRHGYGTGNRNAGQQTQSGYAHKRSSGTWALIIIIAVLTSPIWLGLACGLLGIVVGLAAALAGIVVALLACGVGLFGGGIGMVVYALLHLLSQPAVAMALCGGGILMIAVGILLILAFLGLAVKVFPVFFRFVVDSLQRIFGRGMRGGKSR